MRVWPASCGVRVWGTPCLGVGSVCLLLCDQYNGRWPWSLPGFIQPQGPVSLSWACPGSRISLGGPQGQDAQNPPWWTCLASPSRNCSPPWPRCSQVSGSALSSGPLPATRPAPLWMCKHGNLGHLTHRLAQHGDWIPWAPPAPRSLGRSGFLGWASQPAGARGTRGDPGPEPPQGASHSLGVTWCFGACDRQASRDFRHRWPRLPRWAAWALPADGRSEPQSVPTPRPACSWRRSETEHSRCTQPASHTHPSVHSSTSHSSTRRLWRARQSQASWA